MECGIAFIPLHERQVPPSFPLLCPLLSRWGRGWRGIEPFLGVWVREAEGKRGDSFLAGAGDFWQTGAGDGLKQVLTSGSGHDQA